MDMCVRRACLRARTYMRETQRHSGKAAQRQRKTAGTEKQRAQKNSDTNTYQPCKIVHGICSDIDVLFRRANPIHRSQWELGNNPCRSPSRLAGTCPLLVLPLSLHFVSSTK